MIRALFGEPVVLPRHIIAAYPELAAVEWRRGGLPPRVAALVLRSRTAAITLWRWVFLPPDAPLDPALLLHEFRHVHQFEAVPFFPIRYIWETGRRGYLANRFEVDARRYAAERMAGTSRA
jgi:hypothetical protein